MIEMPDPARAWEYENGFYLTCEVSRWGKFIAHYELTKRVSGLPGAIVECGVFKGTSFVRLAGFQSLLGGTGSKKLIGFDAFGPFPQTNFEADRALRDKLVREAGEQSIGVEQLQLVLTTKGLLEDIELVAGNICTTVPEYVSTHPDLTIALLNLDTDLYEPAVVILEHLWPRIVPGGVMMLDDYGVFPGETKAVDDYFAGQAVKIERFPFAATPSFIVKAAQ